MNRIDIIDQINQEQQLLEYWKQIKSTHNVGENRERRNVFYRHAFMVAAKELSTLTYAAIGNLLKKDHATVIHAERQHDSNMKFDNMYAKTYRNMYMDISDILVTDLDYFSQAGLKEENKELRNRLMKLSRMNRDLIIKKNEYNTNLESLKDELSGLRKELNDEKIRNSNLNKKLSKIVW